MRHLLLGLALATLPLGAAAQQGSTPLSAIDWLSDSLARPVVRPPVRDPGVYLGVDVDKVVATALPGPVSVAPLDGPLSDAVGLLPPSVTGLPAGLWGQSDSATIARLIADPGASASGFLPATRDLYRMLLLAELNPPADSSRQMTLFLARIDALLAMGALEEAKALMERQGAQQPRVFRRLFDTGLLLGTENQVCDQLRDGSGLAPTYPARIFCLARGGDWDAAALTLGTARALGFLDPDEEALMTRFLDPILFEGDFLLPPPGKPSPLEFRIYEAVGYSLPSAPLPLAYSQADLRSNTGWKARLEASERLARAGAISPNQLYGIYTAYVPAASGGVWDRVAAVQEFDAALISGDAQAVSDTLRPAWQAMISVNLERPFADIYGARLSLFTLEDTSAALAFEIGLLSASYESVAARYTASTNREDFLAGLASGQPVAPLRLDPVSQAIADGFSRSEVPARLQGLVDNDQLGEAILRAIKLLNTGAAGDFNKIADSLSFFRAVGLEDTARRAALELMILDLRG
ncbi:hypothetical protein [Candidatus Halocynthiibacter alkanivorans]|uniref:hypothetical protein n=1 Tax=Candidatus Halocynthiibacter alkanivorans TaxID=2267619 RepID=UPI000DF4C684|nr:hypothetical protein [Candidatus Halocynthiibacter alkanivorans]